MKVATGADQPDSWWEQTPFATGPSVATPLEYTVGLILRFVLRRLSFAEDMAGPQVCQIAAISG